VLLTLLVLEQLRRHCRLASVAALQDGSSGRPVLLTLLILEQLRRHCRLAS
jgi:hypothetical protein